jgi:hypothetical protein
MKRVATIISTAFLTVLVTAGAALAQDYPPSVAGGGGGGQGGVSGAGGGGETAFTGGDVSLAAIAFAVLLVIGVTALVVSRRRAARVTA